MVKSAETRTIPLHLYGMVEYLSFLHVCLLLEEMGNLNQTLYETALQTSVHLIGTLSRVASRCKPPISTSTHVP